MDDVFAGMPNQCRYGPISYSHSGVDFLILNVFELLKIEKPTYLDVGASHPIVISNTALLYKRGLRGINIEANPNLLWYFNRDRPEDINVNVGVAPEAGVLPFYCIDKWSGRNSFSKDAIDGFIRDFPQFHIEEVLQIPVTTLNNIANEYYGGKFPDFLSVDIEQFDFDVLASTDFSQSHPKLVCVETIKYDGVQNYEAFRIMMQQKGFQTYCRLIADTVFIWHEDAQRLGLIT